MSHEMEAKEALEAPEDTGQAIHVVLVKSKRSIHSTVTSGS